MDAALWLALGGRSIDIDSFEVFYQLEGEALGYEPRRFEVCGILLEPAQIGGRIAYLPSTVEYSAVYRVSDDALNQFDDACHEDVENWRSTPLAASLRAILGQSDRWALIFEWHWDWVSVSRPAEPDEAIELLARNLWLPEQQRGLALWSAHSTLKAL